MEEDLPPSPHVVNPPPRHPPHDVSNFAQGDNLPQLVNLSSNPAVSTAAVAQGTYDTNQATIDPPFYGPSNQGATTMCTQTVNKVTLCMAGKKTITTTTTTSDAYAGIYTHFHDFESGLDNELASLLNLSPAANPDTKTVAQVAPPAIEEAQYTIVRVWHAHFQCLSIFLTLA